MRRWLPLHVAVYVFAWAFVGTGVAVWLAGTLGAALTAAPPVVDADVARVLMSFGEASITGAVVTLLVAHWPESLASYSDRPYLER